MGGVGGILELNVCMPMIATNLLEEIQLLANAADMFRDKCIEGLEPDTKRCEELIEHSLAMVTALTPKLGYDKAAKIAKQAYESGKTIREVCTEQKILPAAELDTLLDPKTQTGR